MGIFYFIILCKVAYNFYQSLIWKTIQKDIYNRPCFDIDLWGKTYFGVLKSKSFGPFSMNWFQVLGLELPLEDETLIRNTLLSLKNKYKKQFGNIYFQFGILNEIFVYDLDLPLSQSFIENIFEMRKGVNTLMQKDYQLTPSFVENMPLANVFYPVPDQEDFLDTIPSKSKRKAIRKSLKEGLEFRAIKDEEKDLFWNHWSEIAKLQHFFTISHEQYDRLFDFLRETGQGEFFVTIVDGEIMSGGVYVFDNDIMTYLYGFNSRDPRNIGGQHSLSYKVLQWASQNGFSKMNAMGVAPAGVEDHPLKTVSNVKEAIGGYKIEHYGNFDLVINPWLYKLYKWLRR